MTDLKVTPLSEWRKTVLLELPSGNVAEVAPPDIMGMLAEDGSVLSVFMNAAAQEKVGDQPKGAQGALPLEDLSPMLPFIRKVVMASFVNPKVTAEPTAASLGIAYVELQDQLAVLNWAMKGFEKLASFRPESRIALDTLSSGDLNIPEAVRPGGGVPIPQ